MKYTEIRTYKYKSGNPSVSDYSATSLHYAISCNKQEIIKILLNNKKIDVNIPNSNGKTPLNKLGEKQIMELLQNNKVK